MKKYLLISILFLLPCLIFGQSKKSIDGFMDIPFGSDSATVKAAVLAKGGIRVDSLCKKDQLMFSNFSLGQRPVSNLMVSFVNNKAYEAIFFFEYNDSNILSSYDELAADITAIYGKPLEVHNFPEFRSTDAKIRRIRSKDIAIKTMWMAKNKNAIGVQITPVNQSLMLVLIYQENSLAETEAAKRRADL